MVLNSWVDHYGGTQILNVHLCTKRIYIGHVGLTLIIWRRNQQNEGSYLDRPITWQFLI